MNYFKPLRRKIGVCTLVLACVFAAGWVRSHSRAEWIVLYAGDSTRWYSMSAQSILTFFEVVSLIQQEYSPEFFEQQSDGLIGWLSAEPHAMPIEYKWRCAGFSVGYFPEKRYRVSVVRVPYWSIVIPLTLLSAWLLLSKPRVKPNPRPPHV